MFGILGVELGVSAVRGVVYDPERQEVTRAAECPLDGPAVGVSGALNEQVLVPALDDVLYNLGVTSPATVRCGISIGPRHGGVGSGPALHDWLLGKSKHIGQPMAYAGSIGISFAPLRSIEDAQALATRSGLVADRIELAPVAASRVLGPEVEDVVTIGSGRGWRARMRRYEVLEAVASEEVTADEPLRVVTSSGRLLEIESYNSVSIAESLSAVSRLDLGQLAVCVGVALGVAFDSGGNLLVGQVLGEGKGTSKRRDPNRPRQPAADFFSHSPRQSIQELDRVEPMAEAPDHQFLNNNSGLANEAMAAAISGADPQLAAIPESKPADPIRDPYADSHLKVENSYRAPVKVPTPVPVERLGDEQILSPMTRDDLVATHHAAADPTMGQGFDRPQPPQRMTMNAAPAAGAAAKAPPPNHRPEHNVAQYQVPEHDILDRNPPEQDFPAQGFLPQNEPEPRVLEQQAPEHDGPQSDGSQRKGLMQDNGLYDAPRVRHDRSRGSNQPELVSNDALIHQFSPEPDAENWAEQQRGGLNIVLVLLVLSALALLIFYFIF